MRGLFERTMIGEETQYGMESSSDQLEEFHGLTCSLHVSLSGSRRHFSTGALLCEIKRQNVCAAKETMSYLGEPAK